MLPRLRPACAPSSRDACQVCSDTSCCDGSARFKVRHSSTPARQMKKGTGHHSRSLQFAPADAGKAFQPWLEFCLGTTTMVLPVPAVPLAPVAPVYPVLPVAPVAPVAPVSPMLPWPPVAPV